MSKKSSKSVRRSLKSTAFHEAGHAVLDVRFSHRFEFVTIVPEGDAAGYVQYGDDMVTIDPASYDHSDLVQRQVLDSVVMRAFAGMVTECWAHGDVIESKRIWKYADGDLDTVDDLLEAIFPNENDASAYHLQLLLQTNRLLHQRANRISVSVVAAVLQSRWQLPWDDVKRIVEATHESLANVYRQE